MNILKVAQLVEGTVEGSNDIDICGLSGVETAKTGDLTFAVDEYRLSSAEKSATSCVLTNRSMRKSTKTLIRVRDPKFSFVVIFNALNAPENKNSFTHPTAVISERAQLGKGVWVGPRAVIEEGVIVGDHTVIESGAVIKRNCSVGSFCCVYPNVTLYANVKLGDRVILHSGVVVGSDGFGYLKAENNIYKFPQLGAVIIEDDVEIGANTTIDRGSLSDTIIGAGTKIDNLCQIAHNVKIGRNGLIAAQCGISGSTTIGNNVTMGGQAGIVDNAKIGDNVIVGAKSAVIGNVKDGEIVWGIPARPIAQTKRQMAVMSWMAKNFKSIREHCKLERQLDG